jgi:GTP cyclohydrolase II
MARAALPTSFGLFTVHSFVTGDGDPIEDVALSKGAFDTEVAPLTRLHSQCLTGDAFGSLRCDCRDQLELALQRIAEEGQGLVLYLQQDGRGIGTAHKVRAYQLQDEGCDTIDANLRLGFRTDHRTYESAAGMLLALGVSAVQLCTNNPDKVQGLEANGVTVVRRIPLVAIPRPENTRYLTTKRQRLGHLL